MYPRLFEGAMMGEQAANKAFPSADGDAGCTVLKTGRLLADFLPD
jgi:hypothetical protein